MSIFAKMFSWLSSLWNYLFRRNVIDKPPKSRENSNDCIISTDEVGDRGEAANSSFVDVPLNNTIILVDQPAEGPAWKLYDLGDSNNGIENSIPHCAGLPSGEKEAKPEIYTYSERAFGSGNAQGANDVFQGMDTLQYSESAETIYSSSYVVDGDVITSLDPNEEDNLRRTNSCLSKFEEQHRTEDGLRIFSGKNQFSRPDCSVDCVQPLLQPNEPDICSLERSSEDAVCTRAEPTSFDISDVLATSKPANDDPVKESDNNFMLDDVNILGHVVENTLSTQIKSPSHPQVSSSNTMISNDSKPLINFVEGIDGALDFGIDESSTTIIDRMITQCDNVFSVLSSSSITVEERLLEDCILVEPPGGKAVPDSDPGEDVLKCESECDTKGNNQTSGTNCVVYAEYETNASDTYEETLERQYESFESDGNKTIVILCDNLVLNDDFLPRPIEPIHVNTNNFSKEAGQSIGLGNLDLPAKPCMIARTVNLSDPSCKEVSEMLTDAEFIKKNLIEDLILQKVNLEIVGKEECVDPVALGVNPLLTEKEGEKIGAECSSSSFTNLPLQDIAKIGEMAGSEGNLNSEEYSDLMDNKIAESAVDSIINDQEIYSTVGNATILEPPSNDRETKLKNHLQFNGKVESILSNSLKDNLAPTEYFKCMVPVQEVIQEAKKEIEAAMEAFDGAIEERLYHDELEEITSSEEVFSSQRAKQEEISGNLSLSSTEQCIETSNPTEIRNIDFPANSVSSSSMNNPYLSFGVSLIKNSDSIDDPSAGSTKNTQAEELSHEYSTNYSMRSDSLVNFLQDPYDDQVNRDCGPTMVVDPRINAIARTEGINISDGTANGCLESTGSREDVSAYDENLRTNQSVHDLPPPDENFASVTVPKSIEGASSDILKLSESFGNLSVHSLLYDENPLDGVTCDVISPQIIGPACALEILEPSEDPGNTLGHSFFSQDQDSSVNRQCFQSSIDNNFKCFPEDSSTPIAKAINKGFIADNPSFMELSSLGNMAPNHELISSNSSVGVSSEHLGAASDSCHITKENVMSFGEKECHQPIQPEEEPRFKDCAEKNPEFKEENESCLLAPGILDYQLDPCPDVLRSIPCVTEQESDGICLGYGTEFDLSMEQVILAVGKTEPLQNDENAHWKTPGSKSLSPITDSHPTTYSPINSMYLSGLNDYFGNEIWPPSSVPQYEHFSLDSSEPELPSLEDCDRTEHHNNLIDSLELHPFINDDTNSPLSTINHSTREENMCQNAGPPVQINWPSMNEDTNAEPESRLNELHGLQVNDGFPKMGTTYFISNPSALQYDTPPPTFDLIDFEDTSGMVREAEALRRDFALFGNLEQSTRWVETATPITQVAIPMNMAPPTFSGNLVLPDQLPALHGINFTVENGCSQNYISVMDPFGTTVFSTPQMLYNSLFSLPIPLPPVVLPVPPLHISQSIFENVVEDQKRFQAASWRPTPDSDTDELKISSPVVDIDSADSSNPHEPGLFGDGEEDFSFFPRSNLSKNDSLQTLRSKCESFSGSLLGESLKSVMSSLNQEAVRPSMSKERRNYSEPSLITSLKSLSHDSLPTVATDDGFSGGGDDNYSAKVRFLNELNLALNDSLVDDELNNVRVLRRFEEVLGETRMDTKPGNFAVSTDCISSMDSNGFSLNGCDLEVKAKSSFTQSDYDRSHYVVESILEGILDQIQPGRESDTRFSFGTAEEMVDVRHDIENIVQTTNSDEMIQQQMMVFVKHDFDDFHSWEDTNEEARLPDDKLTLEISIDTSQLNSSTERIPASVTAARISCANMDSAENAGDKLSDIVKPPQICEGTVKRGRRRRRKTSAIQLFAEENVIVEEPEKNVISLSTDSVASLTNSKLEETPSDLGFNRKEMVRAADSSDLVKSTSPECALDSSKGKKRNRRRKKKTN